MAAIRYVALTLAIGTVLGVAGCTNSDPLTSGNATLHVNIVIANSPTRFDDAFFFIRQIFVEPTDPASQDAILEPLALVNPRNVIEINANHEGFQFDIPVNLGVGPWRVSSMRLDGFHYEDFDPPASSATCKDYVARWVPEADASTDLTVLPGATFELVPGKVNELTITFDHPAFVSALQDSFLCVPQGVLGCGEAWCLALPGDPAPFFNPAPLFLQAPQYLTFSQ
jgi:hypothetical protein